MELTLRQRFSSLATCWNHLGTLKITHVWAPPWGRWFNWSGVCLGIEAFKAPPPPHPPPQVILPCSQGQESLGWIPQDFFQQQLPGLSSMRPKA